MTKLQTIITDTATGRDIPVWIEVSEQGIFIGAEGYGENSSTPESATPIVVEYNGGELRVIVWSDINKEDPTHLIDMRKAREKNWFSKEQKSKKKA